MPLLLGSSAYTAPAAFYIKAVASEWRAAQCTRQVKRRPLEVHVSVCGYQSCLTAGRFWVWVLRGSFYVAFERLLAHRNFRWSLSKAACPTECSPDSPSPLLRLQQICLNRRVCVSSYWRYWSSVKMTGLLQCNTFFCVEELKLDPSSVPVQRQFFVVSLLFPCLYVLYESVSRLSHFHAASPLDVDERF